MRRDVSDICGSCLDYRQSVENKRKMDKEEQVYLN